MADNYEKGLRTAMKSADPAQSIILNWMLDRHLGVPLPDEAAAAEAEAAEALALREKNAGLGLTGERVE